MNSLLAKIRSWFKTDKKSRSKVEPAT